MNCDPEPLIAFRSLRMQSRKRSAAIHSTTPFQVTDSPDPNLVLRIDAEAVLPGNWTQATHSYRWGLTAVTLCLVVAQTEHSSGAPLMKDGCLLLRTLILISFSRVWLKKQNPQICWAFVTQRMNGALCGQSRWVGCHPWNNSHNVIKYSTKPSLWH
jgi:hypothetical protein